MWQRNTEVIQIPIDDNKKLKVEDYRERLYGEVAESGRLRPSELLANYFGGAVWGNFRENANCGDPPGTLYIPCTFRRGPN